jgi:hypothetical protein
MSRYADADAMDIVKKKNKGAVVYGAAPKVEENKCVVQWVAGNVRKMRASRRCAGRLRVLCIGGEGIEGCSWVCFEEGKSSHSCATQWTWVPWEER